MKPEEIHALKEGDPDFALRLELRHPVGLVEEQRKSTLVFRKPRALDIVRHGVPIKRSIGGPIDEFDIVGDRMNNMLAALSGETPPCLQTMDANDWCYAANLIAFYFVPLPKGWEEASQT